jgi:hypothetical protein
MRSGTMRLVTTSRRLASAASALVVFLLSPATSYAQHGDYLLGTLGLLGASQAALGLIPAGRAARLVAWLSRRGETLHIIQGVAFAFMGALSVSWFLLRFVVPAT